jgi:nitrous oxide reductase accessory protein NosL
MKAHKRGPARKALVAALLAMTILLAGCGGGSSYSLTNPIGEVSEPGLLAVNYSDFDGLRFGEYFPVGEGEMIEFSVSVQTEGGSLSIFVTPEDNEDLIVYRAEDIATSDFTFVLDEPGQYKLWLEAEDHKGGYTISAEWKEKP